MIRLEGINKSFGSNHVLQDISFEIEDGDRLCIIGKSGSGKSVCMKLITGLLPLDDGEIYIDEERIRSFEIGDWNKLMQKVGVVFQGAALFDSLTVLENVGIRMIEDRSYSKDEIREMVLESLESVGLDETSLHKYPAELSGGMRKRVGIARAVLHNPQFLFFDEPTTGLDPLTSETIDELIDKQTAQEDRTSVIITHDLATVRGIATKVAMIHDKQLYYFGTPDEFFNSDDKVIRAFIKRFELKY